MTEYLTMHDLARIYKIDRKTIRKTLALNDDFPRGDSNFAKQLYAFKKHEIDHWLLSHDWAWGIVRANEEVEAARALEVLPPSLQKYKDKEMTSKRGDKAAVQTALLQLELDKKRGRLVDRDDVVTELAPVVVALAKRLEMLPNLIGKKLGFSDDAIRMFRDQLDEARETFMRDAMSGVLSPDYQVIEGDDE